MLHSAEEFVALRTSENPEEYLRAAREEAPVEVWLDVLQRFPEMASWVAHNKTVPLEILELLAEDERADVRFAIAMKNKLSASLFAKLAADPDTSVRVRIAYNKNTPREVLEALALDAEFDVADPAKERLSR